MSLMMKLGLFPFHRYMLKVVGELWGGLFLIVTIFQKMIPFYLMIIILTLWGVERVYLVISVVFRVVVGCIGGLEIVGFSGLISYSSLIHRSWLTLIIIVDLGLFVYYLLIYFMVLTLVAFINLSVAYG